MIAPLIADTLRAGAVTPSPQRTIILAPTRRRALELARSLFGSGAARRVVAGVPEQVAQRLWSGAAVARRARVVSRLELRLRMGAWLERQPSSPGVLSSRLLEALAADVERLRRCLALDSDAGLDEAAWHEALEAWRSAFAVRLSSRALAWLRQGLCAACAALQPENDVALRDSADLQRDLARAVAPLDLASDFVLIDALYLLRPMVRTWLPRVIGASRLALVTMPGDPKASDEARRAPDWYPDPAPLLESARRWFSQALGEPWRAWGEEDPLRRRRFHALFFPQERDQGMATVIDSDGARLVGLPDTGITWLADAHDPASEVASCVDLIARGLRDRHWRPEALAVFVGDATLYGPLLEDALRAHGIPFETTFGRGLRGFVGVSVVLELLETVARGLEGRRLLQMLRAPIFPRAGWGENEELSPTVLEALFNRAAPDFLDSWWRENPPARSLETALFQAIDAEKREALSEGKEASRAESCARDQRRQVRLLLNFLAAFAPVFAAGSRHAFLDALEALIGRLDLPRRLGEGIWSADSQGPALYAHELGAWRVCRRVLRELRALSDDPAPASACAGQVIDLLNAETATTTPAARLQSPPSAAGPIFGDRRPRGRVLVTQFLEARRLERERVFVIGLAERWLPVPQRPAFALPEREEGDLDRAADAETDPLALDEVSPLAEAGLIALDVLAKAPAGITLSFPHTLDGAPLAPASPLAPLWRGVFEASLPAPSEASADKASRPPLSRRAFWEALADRLERGDSPPKALAPLTGADAGVEIQGRVTLALRGLSQRLARRHPRRWSAHEGRLTLTPSLGHARYSASKLESYAECPLRYFLRYHLELEPRPPYRGEIGRTQRGSMLHRIAERFFLAARDEMPDTLRPRGLSWAEVGLTPAALIGPNEEAPPKPRDRWLRARLFSAACREMSAQPFKDAIFDADCLRLLRGLVTPDEVHGEDRARWEALAERFGAEALAVVGHFRLWYDDEWRAQRDTGYYPALFEARFGMDEHGPPGVHFDGSGALAAAPGADPRRQPGFEVRGALDRVDVRVDEGELLAISLDYKTGAPPSLTEVWEGTRFQLPLYLNAGCATLARTAVTSTVRPVAMGYLRLTPGPGRSRVAGLLGVKPRLIEVGLLTKRQRGFADDAQCEAFLGRTLRERLQMIDLGIRQGDFPPAAGKHTAACPKCDYRMICQARVEKYRRGLDETFLDDAPTSPAPVLYQATLGSPVFDEVADEEAES